MTTPIGSLTSTTTAADTSSSAATTTGSDSLGKDTFLKLLVAQLKYQDPDKPADSSQFLAQTAQFTLVEKMEALATSEAQVANSAQLSSATSLVGTSVTYLQKGVSTTGTVSGVSISDGVPTLLVGDTKVDLSQVSKVERAS